MGSFNGQPITNRIATTDLYFAGVVFFITSGNLVTAMYGLSTVAEILVSKLEIELSTFVYDLHVTAITSSGDKGVSSERIYSVGISLHFESAGTGSSGFTGGYSISRNISESSDKCKGTCNVRIHVRMS